MAKPVPSPLHCGADTLVAVHFKMTGPDPNKYDLLEMAFVVSDDYLTPFEKIAPFTLKLALRNPANCAPNWLSMYKINQGYFEDMSSDCDYWQGSESFMYWADTFLSKDTARIQLICWKTAHVYPWLIHWMGPMFGHYFRDRFRDVKTYADARLDEFHYRKIQCVINNSEKAGLLTALGVTNEAPGNTLHEAITTLELYRRLLSLA